MTTSPIHILLVEDSAGDVNLTENDIATSIRALVTGDTATTWQQNGDDIAVVVRLPPSERASTDAIDQISIPVSSGAVPLESIATLLHRLAGVMEEL